MATTPDTNIQYLKGVGEKRAALYRKLGITTVGDLLYHFPRDYIDLTSPCPIAQAPIEETCAVRARLMQKSGEQRIRAGLSLFKLAAEDYTGRLDVTMFNAKYTVENLVLDREYIFVGRMSGGLLHRSMNAPAIYPLPDKHAILPVYPQTAGITSTLMRRHIAQALADLPPLPDLLNPERLARYGLPPWGDSLRAIHFPQGWAQAKAARERFIFEELLILSCGLSLLRSANLRQGAIPMKSQNMAAFWDSLPFTPTGAQGRATADILEDMQSDVPMNRLIQGDVGSGKTLVAAAAVYFCYRNGYQAAFMAPTEILAEQHFVTLTRLLVPLGLTVALLTGSTKASEKRKIRQQLADGTIDLCIGTHALLTDGVVFGRLALAVTDEQHRFGVAQRAKLSQQSKDNQSDVEIENVNILVMSATPIPRTLSLIVFGDLRVSVIDDLPPGRQPIETFVIKSDKWARALGFVRRLLDEGRQAYIVCPLIEMSEVDSCLQSAQMYVEGLQDSDLRDCRVALLHGKMKPKEKESIMRQFAAGELQLLVSTTVIEVGVDVPNATVMMIENAERFGLSQLHQLRGRVGRGQEQSYCILVSDAKGEPARNRLGMLKETTDGFKLAEFDLKTRGPGDFFGFRQHGLPELRVASLSDNMETLAKAKECAAEILAEDPALELPQNSRIAALTKAMLAAVGNRPN